MSDSTLLEEKLASVSYFKDLDKSMLQAIAKTAIQRTFAEEQVVFLEGEPCVGLYLVDSGWLKAVKVSPDGREQVVHFLGQGEVFNAISVFSNTTNPATVIALEPSNIYIIPQETMLRLLEDYPLLARHVIEDLSQRVLHLLSLVEDISLHTVESRLARYLLEYAQEETLQRQRWTTQAEIAARLGTVPHVLNRALRSLVEANLIEVMRHQIRIVDRKGLETRAGLIS